MNKFTGTKQKCLLKNNLQKDNQKAKKNISYLVKVICLLNFLICK